MDPTYPAFPILAFIGFVLVLIPLPWHLQASNSGTCLFMVWTAVALLNKFINAVVWHNNIVDWAPVWCDISTRIDLASGLGLTASSLCISRRLYNIAACQTVSVSKEDRRRDILIDFAIGVGIPLIQLPLHIIVNGHRYDILEDVGCFLVTYNTVPAYPLSLIWTNVLCFISVIYCLLTLRAFLHRRAQFTQFLSSSSSSALTLPRYFRLMALASVELLVNIPVSSYGLYINITRSEVYPWVSWAYTHFDWFTVDKYPALIWRQNGHTLAAIELSRWALILVAFVFFGFFGFADEARKSYKKLGIKLGLIKRPALKPFQLPLHATKSSASSKPPSYPCAVERRDSTASSTVVSSPSIKKDPTFTFDADLESTRATYDTEHLWKTLPQTPTDPFTYEDVGDGEGDDQTLTSHRRAMSQEDHPSSPQPTFLRY